MVWQRTLRFEERADRVIGGLASIALPADVRIHVGEALPFARTYALAEGSEQREPAAVAALVPHAHWFDDAIIALRIEPLPPDALPTLAEALGGDGRPQGVIACERFADGLILEWDATLGSPLLIPQIVAVELRRWNGSHRAQLLAPLPERMLAALAAEGLRAPEIAPDRILETLLERAGVG